MRMYYNSANNTVIDTHDHNYQLAHKPTCKGKVLICKHQERHSIKIYWGEG